MFGTNFCLLGVAVMIIATMTDPTELGWSYPLNAVTIKFLIGVVLWSIGFFLTAWDERKKSPARQ